MLLCVCVPVCVYEHKSAWLVSFFRRVSCYPWLSYSQVGVYYPPDPGHSPSLLTMC